MKLMTARVFAGCFTALAFGTLSHPANAVEPQIFPDIKRIIKAGVIRVAMLDKDVPPLIMTGSNGKLSGTEPDLARDLAQKLGVRVKFIRSANTYDEVVNIVARKDADIAVSYLTGGVKRGLYVFFSQPYIQQNARLFYNRAHYAKLQRDYAINDLQAVNSLPNASKIVVGVEKGSVNIVNMERDFPNLRIKTYANLGNIMAAVKAGNIFAGMHGSLQTDFYLRSNPALAIYIAVDSKIRVSSDIRIAVRPDAPDLLHWINLYLANYVGMMDHDKTLNRYLENEQETDNNNAKVVD